MVPAGGAKAREKSVTLHTGGRRIWMWGMKRIQVRDGGELGERSKAPERKTKRMGSYEVACTGLSQEARGQLKDCHI